MQALKLVGAPVVSSLLPIISIRQETGRSGSHKIQVLKSSDHYIRLDTVLKLAQDILAAGMVVDIFVVFEYCQLLCRSLQPPHKVGSVGIHAVLFQISLLQTRTLKAFGVIPSHQVLAGQYIHGCVAVDGAAKAEAIPFEPLLARLPAGLVAPVLEVLSHTTLRLAQAFVRYLTAILVSDPLLYVLVSSKGMYRERALLFVDAVDTGPLDRALLDAAALEEAAPDRDTEPTLPPRPARRFTTSCTELVDTAAGRFSTRCAGLANLSTQVRHTCQGDQYSFATLLKRSLQCLILHSRI